MNISHNTPSQSRADSDERYARLNYTEAAVVIDTILRIYNVCDDGKRIAWCSASIIQNAIDRARRGE